MTNAFRRPARPVSLLLLALAAVAAMPRAAAAQAAAPTPAFSLASSHLFTTREQPSIYVSFRQVGALDFRVYRVNDAAAFFAKLKEPHVLGGPEPEVAQEPTLLERIADWKARWRADVRSFFRRQFSPQYRAARRAAADRAVVAERRVVRAATFAQVPLLNAAQVVTSWREILPPLAEADGRRIPLELDQPGVYVVEAVHDLLRAYTIVVISDVGLVTKSAPGQLLVYAVDRFSGAPVPGCALTMLADQSVAARGETAADGTYAAALDRQPDNVVVVAACGKQVAVSDPGAWYLREKPRELLGYVYTDKPVYRPGHTVRLKAVLRWRTRGALLPFDRPRVEVAVMDTTSKVVLREMRQVDEFGSVNTSWTVPVTAALGYYTIRVHSEDDEAFGHFEVQEYRRPEFEVKVTSSDRFVVQGGRTTATIEAKYYFGQPVAGGRVKYVLSRGYYTSPLRWTDEPDDGGGWYGGHDVAEQTAELDPQGRVTVTVPVPVLDGPQQRGEDYSLRITAHVTDASDREVSGAATVYGTYGTFMVIASASQYLYQPGATAALDVRAIDYVGTPRPHVPMKVWLERLRYTRGYGQPETSTIAEGTVETGADGRARWTTTIPNEAGSYRFHAAAQAGARSVEDTAYVWVPGRTSDASAGDQYPGAAAGSQGVPARRRGEARAPRRGRRRLGARDEGGRADHLAPRLAARRERGHRGAHRRGGHRRHLREPRVREGRPAVPGREAPARPRHVARGARGHRGGAGRIAPARARRLHDPHDRRRRPARPRRGQPVGDRRSRVRRQARLDARPAALLLPPRVQPRRHVVLARVPRSSATRATSACSSPSAGVRSRSPTSRAAASKPGPPCARSSPTRSTGSRTSTRAPTAPPP